MLRIPRLLLSGIGSGVGKTAVMLGIAAAMRRRGLAVASFTLGPDGHDAPLLEAVTGRTTHCLDPWLMGRQTLRRTFQRGLAKADIALIEGALGLFDGIAPTSDEGSTAELARWLELPVLLVVDGANLGASIAAIARGFERFDPRVSLAGLIANHVGDPVQVRALRTALEACGGAPLLGGLPTSKSLAHPGRDLGPGLKDADWLDAACIERLARITEEHLDLDAILALARAATPLPESLELAQRRPCARIGIAFDAAFDRHFEDDLVRLEAAGAELVAFSPLRDTDLPDVDGLYFGDGNVESHTSTLSGNSRFRTAVRDAIVRGVPTLALGGGMVYLARGVRTLSGTLHPLVGALDLELSCTPEPSLSGYVEVETTCETLVGPSGTHLRGHAWRHVRPTRAPAAGLNGALLDGVPLVRSVIGPPVAALGGAQLFALPFRTHWASSPKVPEAFVAACARDTPAIALTSAGYSAFD